MKEQKLTTEKMLLEQLSVLLFMPPEYFSLIAELVFLTAKYCHAQLLDENII